MWYIYTAIAVFMITFLYWDIKNEEFKNFNIYLLNILEIVIFAALWIVTVPIAICYLVGEYINNKEYRWRN